MPDLNLIDEGGIEETPTPSAPMPKKGGSSGGGSLNKILLTVLVLLIVGSAGFYLYKKGKLPFMKKKAPVTQVQEETFPDTQPLAANESANAQTQTQVQGQAQDTATVPLLETPLVDESAKKSAAKDEKKGADAQKPGIESAPMKKLTEMQGAFTIQVSAFRDKKQADEIVGRLEDAGYPAFVETIPMKGVNWFTVRIGHYPSRVDAKKAVGDFALELRSNYWIDKIRNK
jgi:septal ring-binding cell division protein DamX